MIQGFDEWSASFADTRPQEDLRGAVIAIEAADYLSRMMSTPPTREPLLSALAGHPFTMEVTVKNNIRRFRDLDITPLFVFSGLEVGKNTRPFEQSEKSSRTNADAWELYNHQEPEKAVETFGKSGSVKPEDLFRYLQSILKEEGVKFQVAPYSAWAQLAYLERHPRRFVDAVMGSSELLLFDVDKVITNWDNTKGEFSWVKRRACLAELGNITPDMFVDACLLAGSKLSPTFPLLENGANRKHPKLKAAVDLMSVSEFTRSGNAVCLQHEDAPQMRATNYIDRFRRSKLAVKHHVILTDDGKVEPLDSQNVPNDVHEFIGQRLPDELYLYLSKGMVGSRLLNWLTSGEIIELPPLDGGESEEYRTLVTGQLKGIRTTALALILRSLTRFYQYRDLTFRCWFEKDIRRPIAIRDITDYASSVASWSLKTPSFADAFEKCKGNGSLSRALLVLKDPSFASSSTDARSDKQPLTDKDEIIYNCLWRFLQLRGYVDSSSHKLTKWGESLSSMLETLSSNPELEEAAFIAMELLRLGLLDSANMFPAYSGAPFRGSDTDRRNTLLISRIACLGKLEHNAIGFTGPLSKHLLGYQSIINTTRSTLRDLMEATLVQLFLGGGADRDRSDFSDLGLELPFLLSNDCGLGIAVKSYFDELVGTADRSSAEVKQSVKERGATEWFPHSINFAKNIDKAFVLWDAVYKGVKVAGSLAKNASLFDEVNEWLEPLR